MSCVESTLKALPPPDLYKDPKCWLPSKFSVSAVGGTQHAFKGTFLQVATHLLGAYCMRTCTLNRIALIPGRYCSSSLSEKHPQPRLFKDMSLQL
jgi:hypothetical protein